MAVMGSGFGGTQAAGYMHARKTSSRPMGASGGSISNGRKTSGGTAKDMRFNMALISAPRVSKKIPGMKSPKGAKPAWC